MKFYPNNCQKCYEVLKLYNVRLLLLLELGELGRWVHAKIVDGERGDGLSQHGRETQDGEVQRQLFNEGNIGQGDRRTKGQWRGKSRGHKHGRPQKFS